MTHPATPHLQPPAGPEPAPRLINSRLLQEAGIPHAFTTRVGGVSPPPFDSLNFGNPSELPPERRDPRENIQANIRSVLAALGTPHRALVEVHQVHGCDTHLVLPDRPPHPTPSDTKADALATTDPTRILAVRVADCTPILLASADGRAVAAVHAGWRGVVSGVAASAVRTLREIHPHAPLLAAIGPCIGPDHFEVGPEVVEEFARAGLLDAAAPRPSPAGRTLLDLQSALAHQFLTLGVEQIDRLPFCTVSRADLFFSHRRDRGITGRMMALIGPRA